MRQSALAFTQAALLMQLRPSFSPRRRSHSPCDKLLKLPVLAQVFRTDGPVAARYGLVARNRIWFGSTVHWFDQIKQVIFEENTATGISLVSVSRAPRPSCCCSVRIRFMLTPQGCVRAGRQ